MASIQLAPASSPFVEFASDVGHCKVANFEFFVYSLTGLAHEMGNLSVDLMVLTNKHLFSANFILHSYWQSENSSPAQFENRIKIWVYVKGALRIVLWYQSRYSM